LHDIRRSAATGLQRLGAGLQVVEAILGHVSGSRAGVVGVYQRHRFVSEMRVALEQWAHEVERIASGKKKAGDHVITPPAARLTLFVTAKPTKWLAAIKQAQKTNSPEPLIEYLRQPGAQLGPTECLLLRLLLERIGRFVRKKRGGDVLIGQKSRKEIHKFGAELVRKLQAEGLQHEKAIDTVAQTYPEVFGPTGASLANFMRKQQRAL
jgi:hypothetical protein